jgi:DNA-binding NtrC family response regulator
LHADQAGGNALSAVEGLSFLLVEDSYLVAVDCEAVLIELGAAEVHIASNMAEARDVLSRAKVDFVLLDLDLGQETGAPLAAILAERDIPFVIATGYGEDVLVGALLAGRPAVFKPYTVGSLERVIGETLKRRGRR